MGSQQAACARLVVDALVAGRFSHASVMAHLYDALQALVHDAQHRRLCRRLLKHLPMVVSRAGAPAPALAPAAHARGGARRNSASLRLHTTPHTPSSAGDGGGGG